MCPWPRCVLLLLVPPLLCTLLASRQVAAQRTVEQRTYDCRVIARSSDYLGPFFGVPAQNAYGDVIFSTTLQVGAFMEQQIRIGRGDALANGTPITKVMARVGGDPADPTIPLDQLFTEPVIDDLGRGIFVAAGTFLGTGTAVYSISGTGDPFPLVPDQDMNPLSPFVGFFDALPTAVSGVLFNAVSVSGQNGIYVNQIFLAPTNGTAPGEFSIFPPALIAPHSLDTAWIGQEFNNSHMAVFLNQSAVDESVEVLGDWMGNFGGLSVGANGGGFVAYARDGIPPDTEWKLLRTSSSSSRTILVDSTVDALDPLTPPVQTSVNAWGEVAFVAKPDSFAPSLLLADGGPVVHRVRCPAFDAISVSEYQISPRALNADGQIAFRAHLIDPVTLEQVYYYMRADPIPGQGARPTSCVGLADATPCDDGDPETLSSCSGQVCVGDPLGRPTSCVGLADDTACDDQLPDTYSFCASETCESIPIPEPRHELLLVTGCAALAALRARSRAGPHLGRGARCASIAG